jgi:phospholipase C
VIGFPGITSADANIRLQLYFCFLDQSLYTFLHRFRVPLVVVSAYTPQGYLDNLRYDFGSILRFVEHNFGIPEGALNCADQRATNDLTSFFNLNMSPRTFNVIRAPLGEEFS